MHTASMQHLSLYGMAVGSLLIAKLLLSLPRPGRRRPPSASERKPSCDRS